MTANWKMLPHGKNWGVREIRKQVLLPGVRSWEAQLHNGERLRIWDHHLVRVALKGEEGALGGMEVEGR